MIRTTIAATGSYIPEVIVKNEAFENHHFYEADGLKLYRSNKNIIEKFTEITGIRERRYVSPKQMASDIGYYAAKDALDSSGIDAETLDYIIVAHNFGDVSPESNRVTMVPSLGSKIKSMLNISNPACVAYDMIFGCPGWIEGVIQADCFIRSGQAKRCLVIGTETLSRVIDPHDRDSMIYSDGSGAAIVEASDDDTKGVLAHKSRTFASGYANLLHMSSSYSDYTSEKDSLFLKMNGRKVYEFALNNVPNIIVAAIEKAGLTIGDISKILVHQANDKMDQAILERAFKLCNQDVIPEGIMPMTIGWLGNSSVATVPTLLDLILKKKLEGHTIGKGDNIVMASVGAGMNVNALVYRA
ncbi:MAG TPA: ketoacyl-ACP synthase III [Chryseosolibacter sp.]|nr:ketoacyl-ACP synthase III [Chryseosolibacter sp.]